MVSLFFDTGWQWLMMMVIDDDWQRCFTMVDNYPLHGGCMGLWWLIVVHGLLSLLISWYSGTDWLEVPCMIPICQAYISGRNTLLCKRSPRWDGSARGGEDCTPADRGLRPWVGRGAVGWTFLNIGSVGDSERLRISNPGKVRIFQGVLRMFQVSKSVSPVSFRSWRAFS